MAGRLDALFSAVRDACEPAVWSRGVELTRAGAVVALPDDSDDDELAFRVSPGGNPVGARVRLFLDDADWECQCPSREDVCEHVAAAVIAFRRDEQEGAGVVRAVEDVGQVVYHFTRVDGGLALHRTLLRGDRSYPLDTTLASLAEGRPGVPPFTAGQADLAAELTLGTHRRGLLPRPLVERLFRRLARCSSLRLEDEPVVVSADPVLPILSVTDQGPGFRLALADDTTVTETFGNGIALCGDTLRPVGEARLTGRELEELSRGRGYGPDQVGELVTGVLPDLGARIPIDVRTDRLPEAVHTPPWVRLETSREGAALSVLATLVYGRPPTARVEDGRLVHLKGKVPVRDEAGERLWTRKLVRELGLAPGVRETFVGEDAVAFAGRLDGWQDSVIGAAPEHFAMAPPLVPSIGVEGGRLDLAFDSRIPETGGAGRRVGAADPAAVLRAWRHGESMVPLLEGGWAPLPGDWLERFGHKVSDLLGARDESGRLPACMGLELADLCEDLEQPVPPELGRLKRLLADVDKIPRAPLPADLTATLRPYQKRGVDWLSFLRASGLGGLLADDMGLGKTLQALCAVEGRTLVVAPTSVLHNWQDEIRRFRPGLAAAVYHGPSRTLDPEADVTLTTYAILRLDVDALAAVDWDTVVLDEAQAIKNPDSQVARAAFRLKARFALTLTGTPVENRLEELWSQLHFSNRGLLGGRSDFQERYAAPVASGEPGAAARLRARIRPFVLRRLKSQVAADLPPRTDIVLRCELTESERDVYDTIRAATLSGVLEQLGAGGNVLAALEALLRLRQAACHPGLVPGHEAAGSSKLTLLLETLDSVIAEGHKALVFSQWTSLLDRVQPGLAEAGHRYVRLDGSTADRAGVVGRFQSPDGPPVMLVSLKAGGTGLNLTAADHVFLLDPWWNPAVEDQAADRAHRIGQDRPVMVYRLVAENTVEERILELQESKRGLADAALGDADRAAGLTRDELMQLLS